MSDQTSNKSEICIQTSDSPAPSSDLTDLVERLHHDRKCGTFDEDECDCPVGGVRDLIKTLREQRDETARTAWANRDAYLTELQALRSENVTLKDVVLFALRLDAGANPSLTESARSALADPIAAK